MDPVRQQKAETLETIQRLGLIAVLRAPSEPMAEAMVDALVAGGVTGIEITYSTPNAAAVVRSLATRYGSRILLGLGTLTQPDQVDEARSAGARFIVSPHVRPDLAEAMAGSGLATLLGAFSPTEVELAHRLGADVVKLFPAALGGPSYLRSLRGPFPTIPLMPSGGISTENVVAWFAAGAVAVSAGSELAPLDWAKDGRFGDIANRARAFVAAVEAARPTAARDPRKA